MIRLTLWSRISRSLPAMSTPNENAVRIVIEQAERTNATNTAPSVKRVRIFRRHRFFQTRAELHDSLVSSPLSR